MIPHYSLVMSICHNDLLKIRIISICHWHLNKTQSLYHTFQVFIESASAHVFDLVFSFHPSLYSIGIFFYSSRLANLYLPRIFVFSLLYQEHSSTRYLHSCLSLFLSLISEKTWASWWSNFPSPISLFYFLQSRNNFLSLFIHFVFVGMFIFTYYLSFSQLYHQHIEHGFDTW